ncbi:glycosyltransferase family 4 protein [Actinopolymorpha sp. NPDC004070]|uniref:glycosyltransferase family 4 protein n=1 Tax=Actinopolymorpha sp. NPDC004070 TaxID=3154548 RepID=UPI0033BC2833
MKTVWIVQPYVPRYRIPLFEQLGAQLSTAGVELRVAAGAANDVQAERGDEVRPDWLVPMAWTRFGPAQISHARRLYRGADGVVFPHLGSNPELSAALIARTLGRGTPVGVWGHIKTYVDDPNPLDVAIERWQLHHADRVFAYTAGGARYASDAGVEPGKIVTLNNTVDTHQLKEAIEILDDREVLDFQSRYNLVPDRTIAYIGGLDESKRIDMLAETLDRLWELHPTVKLIVGGRGRSAGLLNRAEVRGQVIRLGYVDEKMKALIASTAQILVNPGRVGLLAVEALVMGLPVATTQWPYHAPEVEYLVEGETIHSSANDAESFLGLILELLHDQPPKAFRTTGKAPLMSDMVATFARGILAMLDR